MAARVVVRRPRRARPPPLRARPHPRHALRGADAAPAACGCTGSAVTALERALRRRARARTSPSSRTTAIAGRDFDKALELRPPRRRPRARAARLRGGRAPVRSWRSTRSTRRAGDDATRCELLLSLGDARSRAGDDAGGQEARSLEAADDRAAARPAASSWPAPRRVRRADHAGRAPATTTRLVPLLEEGSPRSPRTDVELRVRLLARLAGALRDEPSRDAARRAEPRGGRARPPQRGPARARLRARRPRVAIVAPRHGRGVPRDRQRARARWRERAATASASCTAHYAPVGPLLTLGRLDEAEASLAAASRIADELRQPAQLWHVPRRAGDARARGRHARRGRGADRARRARSASTRSRRSRSRSTGSSGARSATSGELEEVEPAIRELAAELPGAPGVPLRARASCRRGSDGCTEARRALDELARDASRRCRSTRSGCSHEPARRDGRAVGRRRAAAASSTAARAVGALNVVDQCEAIAGLGRALPRPPRHDDGALARGATGTSRTRSR